ncbi:hypothetical protein ACFLX7_05610, partial [Chloroflexota bacterium]
SIMEEIRTALAGCSVTIFLWDYLLSHPVIIVVVVFVGLTAWGYFDNRKSTAKETEYSPIKSVAPSREWPQLEIKQFISNVKDDNFYITAFVDIEVENNTDHILKIASSTIVLQYDHKYTVKHQLYRKRDMADCQLYGVQRFPIEIKTLSASKENQYALDYAGMVTIKPRYQHTHPKKAWVCFELIGAQTPTVCHPVKFNADWDAVGIKGKN